MQCRGQNGFSLMEMVIVLTMLALLAAVAGPYLANGVRAYNDTSSSVHTLGKLRAASERLVREIREIGNNGTYQVFTPVSAPNSSLRFTKTDTETVTIDTSASLLRLGYASINTGIAYTLSDELASLVFRYWQADGVTAATGNADLAIIEFELVLNHAGNNYAQRSRVALRNLP
ncbi:MAG TPA: type II secretion system protein [Gammaproteobacteria bacterium]|nr:type II secretion system protein [Gammaproteobacteria bacterium]